VSATLEQRLLSACLSGDANDVLGAVGKGVVEASFHEFACKAVWRALVRSVGDGTGVEPAYVAKYVPKEFLTAFYEVSAIGETSAYLKALTRDLLDAAATRRLVDSTAKAHAAATQASGEGYKAAWEATEPFLRAAQDTTGTGGMRTFSEGIAEAKRRILSPSIADTVSTGIPLVDQVFGKPRLEELIVIAARPGMGKSMLASQITLNIAKTGKTVAFYSLEMGMESIQTRMAKCLAFPRAPMDDIVVKALDELDVIRTIRIFESRHCSKLAQIEAQSRLLAASPGGLGAIVADYLQIISPPVGSKNENREQQVAAMSKAFKALATELRVPVFLLAQLNRASELGDRPPTKADLRESGAIEQDADRIWFLYQPKPASNEMPPAQDAAVIKVALLQAKNREGAAGVEVLLTANRRSMVFHQCTAQ
jgi:replicative DNA helicase